MRKLEFPTYEINKVADFASVPADRLNLYLTEFQAWVGMHRVAVQMLGDRIKDATFVWIDDGKTELSISATIEYNCKAKESAE